MRFGICDNGAMPNDTPPMSSDTKRSLIVNWGVALLALFLAWKFSMAPVMWGVTVLGTALILHGHWPDVFKVKRIAVFLLLSGQWLVYFLLECIIVSDWEGQNPRLQATALARARQISFGDGIPAGRAHCI
jgi:hypothetical protein